MPHRFGIMKPDKHLIGAWGIVFAAAVLIGLTWMGTLRAIHAQRLENAARVNATLSNQALTLAEQINRQLLALDQTLQMLVAAREKNPNDFNLESRRSQAVVLSGISRDMVLTDAAGIVRQSSVLPAINADVSGLDYFEALSAPDAPAGAMYIGPATIDAFMRQWHMNVARPLHHPDGSFAGVINADYRIAALLDIFRQTDLGRGGFVTLIGLNDGKMRGTVGPAAIDPDVNISETRMFAAIQRGDKGQWTGPTAIDPVQRIHAYRRIPGRALVLVVAMDEAEAMMPATTWRREAETFAVCITALLAGLAGLLVNGTRLARKRERAMARDSGILAAANAQLEAARSLVTAKAERLEATLAGMTDGVSMFDGHLCLVEWNARFPQIAGVPEEILRVGLPMEEVLRAQVATGQFGRIDDPEAEVQRRIAAVRAAPYGVAQRQTPEGRMLELRRNRLPDGGFVTLYSDITDHKRTEAELRRARAEAEAANAAKSRFIAIVSHEIRTPLNTLLNTVRLLGDSALSPPQQSLLALARQSGDVLHGLINDILAMSQMEAGKLVIRPSLFDLRQLLGSCTDMFAPQAAERGIALRIDMAPGTPAILLTDPGRLRQVLLNLLSNALKYARPGEVLLTAEPGPDKSRAATLMVKDGGPMIPRHEREALFRPFSRADRPESDDLDGTGLGLSICHHLMTLMGGEIGCEAWSREDGSSGNAFWISLPAVALPPQDPRDGSVQAEAPGAIRAAGNQGGETRGGEARAGEPPAGGGAPNAEPADAGAAPRLRTDGRRPVPRTRILLADDILANQMVTATLLRREGHAVDVVGSGQAAVKAVQQAPYDLILMDIFMPGMGGQEATRAIRALPGPAGLTPIVALTANVTEEDAAVFREAGMNGILGKPVALAELLEALCTHVWAAPGRAAATEAPAENSTKPQAHDPWAVLSLTRIRELRTNLPPETFITLVEECIADLDHRLPALRRAIAAGSPGAIIAHAHAMVGMAGGYGMAALETRLRMILAAVRDGDSLTLSAAVAAEVEADLAEAARTLREISQSEVV
jgi:signal transduction histidine kinase/CheY-like chemotaxis protein/HPt (histidine-containing phosphotransfer) domain-containing protein